MLVASLTFGVARAGNTNVRLGAAATGPLLGITGNIARFQSQTGQASSVHHAFLGWGHGLSYGSTFAALFPTLGPIPMIHLGTEGQSAPEAITPGGIAAGQGDGYLVALNKAIATWNKGIYVRPLAEMNNSANAWSGYRANGQPKDAAHSPATYRKAFARIYVILHGGSASAVNAKLRQLGLPPVQGELFSEPLPEAPDRLEPARRRRPSRRGQRGAALLPGAGLVDVDGGSIYDERLTDTAPWQGLENLYRLSRSHKKPFSVPEWGLSQVDDPAFVQHMCTFLKTHTATEVAAFYESRPGSRYDLESKPKSRAAYRECITPLAGPLPAWAGRRAEGDRPEADLEPWLRAGAARRRILDRRAPQRSDRALAAHLRRRLRGRRRRPAARNRPARVRARRHLRGDVDRLFVTPVHSRVRSLHHLGRGDRRNRAPRNLSLSRRRRPQARPRSRSPSGPISTSAPEQPAGRSCGATATPGREAGLRRVSPDTRSRARADTRCS